MRGRVFVFVGHAPSFHSQSSHPERENQDCVLTHSVDDVQFVALADEQGGQAGGALAARIATSAALDFLVESARPLEPDALRVAVSVADKAVENEPEAGFTTLIVLCATATQVVGACVGDSQVWHLSGDGVGELSAKQRKNPPLGSGGAMGTLFQFPIQSGDQILAMSDGVFRFIEMSDIVRTCRDSADADVIGRLLDLQRRSAEGELPDDWSVALRFAPLLDIAVKRPDWPHSR